MKFSDIPQFTRSAPYAVDVPWRQLEVTLARYAESGELQMDPEFQRAHVWDETKQRRYVEYVLRGGKSSRDIYWNHANWMRSFKGPMYLVDGKQRIEAVRKFLRNELPVFGDVGFVGHYLHDFEDKLSYGESFCFHINDLQDYTEVLQWYLDLNEGGVVHTEDELAKVRQLLRQAELARIR